ncbi:formate dehydrogenase accessory sulfurtransferase FdhD [Spirosoma taeanense]|uniref:Sulfur carrier protein FdhD n=1 Tax=Spirosoma taeanense TaxID=2735870 RepID=A0A6M5YBM5_9BACT|nr:formate dehydrogenase accessory sulfurtransferase FdhD [Spirosoma taeanense]QJW90680.1 formate dehydrogenase accessory sulfurtransferase FdhD [Spirosoma taeanense]
MQRVAPISIHKITADSDARQTVDLLAVEEPLEIRLGYGEAGDRQQRSLSVTMRTPGHDFELALGFLLTEGVIQRIEQVHTIRYCTDLGRQEAVENIVRVELKPDVTVDLHTTERNFYTTSSCGVCGKASIDAVRTSVCPVLPPAQAMVDADLVHTLPDKLHEAQAIFNHTGGLHAAALFDTMGQLLLLREDVGRHNALDKVIGAALQAGLLPLSKALLFLSGRISFELVQKALAAGVPLVAAVGAPSSLAVQMASEFGLTLLGFVRNHSFNLYTCPGRVLLPEIKSVSV